MRNASVNSIPYFLMKFENAKFEWINKEEGIGRLNGGRVNLRVLPLYMIFFMKTLPIFLITFYLSNNFFLIREFFSLQDGKVLSMIGAISLFTAIYSLFVRKGGFKIALFVISLGLYMVISYVSLQNNLSWAFQIGIGATIYICMMIYAVLDLFLILTEQKQMYFVANGYPKSFTFWRRGKNKQKKELFNFRLEGLFVNLYANENYEVQNDV